MDFDPGGSRDIGCLRLVVNGEPVTAPGSFASGEYHHLVNHHVGTDSGPFSDHFQGPASNYHLRGNVDDVVVMGRALQPAEVRMLRKQGAAAFFETGNMR